MTGDNLTLIWFSMIIVMLITENRALRRQIVDPFGIDRKLKNRRKEQ